MDGFLVLVNFQTGLPAGWEIDPSEAQPGNGFLGTSIWTGLGEVETAVRLIHYTDAKAANEHLRQRVERTDEPPEVRDFPPVVHNLTIRSGHGQTLETTEVGSYLTIAHSVASPGYGSEVGRRVEETLQGIELVEGFAGYIRGSNVALPDEVWALVFWSSPPNLPAPSDDVQTTFNHYRRIG